MRQPKRVTAKGSSALGALFMLSSPCLAQPAPPASALPNAGLPTREEVVPARPRELPDQHRLKVTGGLERSTCPLDDPAYADLKVTIDRVVFNKLGPVSPAALLPSYQSLLGPDRPVATICEIRDAAAAALRKRGYLAAIQVPAQRIENNTVVLEVLYARLVAVRVRGDAGKAERLLASYLDKLTRDPVFNQFAAERYLLLARDLPGYDVQLALRPTGVAPGELIGDVTVKRRSFDADVSIQNYASKATGRFGGQLRGQIYGLTGMGDRTTLAFYSTADFKEQKIVQAAHELRVGGEGLTFSGRFTYAWTKPDIPALADIRARTLYANIEAAYPLVRSRARDLQLAAGLDYVNQVVRFAGTPLSRDKLRVAYVRLDGTATDIREDAPPRWLLSYSFELRHGLDIFGASDGRMSGGVGPSRANADGQATLLRMTASLELPLTTNLTFSLAPRAQYAFDPLLSFEQYSAGNYTVGRGYDPGTIIGDSGVGTSAELRVNRVTPFANRDIVLQPFAFVDSAWVWTRKGPAGSQNLSSVGAGLRASIADRARLDMTLAVPTKRAGLQAHRGDVRFLVSFISRLYPWSIG